MPLCAGHVAPPPSSRPPPCLVSTRQRHLTSLVLLLRTGARGLLAAPPLLARVTLLAALTAPLVAQSPQPLFWLQRFPRTAPWPSGNGIGGSSLTFDAGRQRMVLFGGTNTNSANGTFDQTLELRGADWVAIATGPRPSPRAYHAAASLAPAPGFLLHGGFSFSPSAAANGDTWHWNGTAWRVAATTGPAPRWLHAVAFDVTRQRAVLFGGDVGAFASIAAADTWEWNGTQWTQQAPATSPPPRLGHALAFDQARSRVVLFGGATSRISGATLGDTWEWDGSNWTPRTPLASPPTRCFHAMYWDAVRGAIVLHGGRATLAGPPSNDAWEWDVAANTWRLLTAAGGTPPAVDLFALGYDVARSRAVLVGGWNGSGFAGATWELLPAVPLASAVPYGSGCGGSPGVPALAGVGMPRIGNGAFALQLGNAAPSSPAALLFGEGHDAVPLGGGCSGLVASPFVTIGGTTNPSGVMTWPLPVPNLPFMLGRDHYAQAVVADPQGAFLGLAAFSNGLAFVLGN